MNTADRVAVLCARYQEGSLDSKEREELSGILRHDTALRVQFTAGQQAHVALAAALAEPRSLPLADRVAAVLEHSPVITSQQVVRAAHHRRRTRLRVALACAAVLLVALAASRWLVVRGDDRSAVSPRLIAGVAYGEAGQLLSASNPVPKIAMPYVVSSPMRLAFTDGTVVHATPGTQWSLAYDRDDVAQFIVTHGTVSASVPIQGTTIRTWLTTPHLQMRGESARFEFRIGPEGTALGVQKGTVAVRRSGDDGITRLQAGDDLHALDRMACERMARALRDEGLHFAPSGGLAADRPAFTQALVWEWAGRRWLPPEAGAVVAVRYEPLGKDRHTVTFPLPAEQLAHVQLDWHLAGPPGGPQLVQLFTDTVHFSDTEVPWIPAVDPGLRQRLDLYLSRRVSTPFGDWSEVQVLVDKIVVWHGLVCGDPQRVALAFATVTRRGQWQAVIEGVQLNLGEAISR